MRILFSYGLVGRGGDAVQVIEMAESFRQLGHVVELVGPHELQPYEFAGTEGHLRNWLRRFPWWAKDTIELGLQLRLWRQARHRLGCSSFDLVFHRAGIYDLVGVPLARAACCPSIIHLDAPFPIERAFRNDGYFACLHRRCMRRLGKVAELVVTVSTASRDYYVELGLPEAKILVQPNGVPQRLLQKGTELARLHRPFAQGPPFTIGFVGSLSRWHRVDLLLEALHLLEAEYPGRFRLYIVGHGEEYPNLRMLERKLGIGDRITWFGPLPHEHAFEQIALFDIAVLPNTLPTGAPIKLFEYAAMARPVILPDLENLRGLFTEKEMCFVAPGSPRVLAETLLKLCSDQDATRRVGQKAQQRVQQYTWESIITQLLRTLNRCA